jgi:hypothetical protein
MSVTRETMMRTVSGLMAICVGLLASTSCKGEAASNVEIRAEQPAPAPALERPQREASPARLEVAAGSGAAAAPSGATAAQGSQPNVAAAAGEKGAQQGSAKQPAVAGESAKKVAAHQGSVVSEDAFSTWLQADTPVAAGTPGYVEAVLVANAPYHCNAEYPHKFKLNAAPPGITYPEEVVRGMAVTAERGVLRIPLSARQAGAATVSGTLSFSVCTEERCMVEKRELSLNLDVK